MLLSQVLYEDILLRRISISLSGPYLLKHHNRAIQFHNLLSQNVPIHGNDLNIARILCPDVVRGLIQIDPDYLVRIASIQFL